MTAYQRFVRKVNKTDTCWLWTGCRLRSGYGQFSVNSKRIYAHRYSYEHHNRPIPTGLVIDHLCRNRGCVNPDHLEAVTSKQNILRGYAPTAFNSRKTKCPRGHEFTEDNLYRYRGARTCLICKVNQRKEHRARSAV